MGLLLIHDIYKINGFVYEYIYPKMGRLYSQFTQQGYSHNLISVVHRFDDWSILTDIFCDNID